MHISKILLYFADKFQSMCYNAIHIRNNSTTYRPLQPFYLNVPCGKCEDCLNSRRFSWYCRSYAEFKSHPDWSCVFYTLTFNEENIPRIYGRKCFDLSIFQKFIKRLRQRLLIPFSYLCVSEYGELYARPHHHVLFYFPKTITNKEFYDKVLLSWQQGFIHVKAGTNYGQITGVQGLRYATKYVTKDISRNFQNIRFRHVLEYARRYKSTFIDVPFSYDDNAYIPQTAKDFKRFVTNFSKSERVNTNPVYNFYLSFRRTLSHHLPFTTASNGFGAKVVDILTSSEIESFSISLPTDKGFQSFALPQYLQRKLFYNRVYNENTGKCDLFRLNSLGMSVLQSRLQKSIDELAYICRTLPLSFTNITELPDNFKLPAPFTLRECLQYIKDFNDFDGFAKWRLLYRYSVHDLTKSDIFNSQFSYDFYHYSLYEKTFYCDTPPIQLDKEVIQSYMKTINSNHLYYGDYELLSQIYDVLTSYLAKASADVRVQQENVRRHASQLHKLKHLIQL